MAAVCLQAANELLKRQLGTLRADSGRAALLADQLQRTQVCMLAFYPPATDHDAARHITRW